MIFLFEVTAQLKPHLAQTKIPIYSEISSAKWLTIILM